MTIINDKSFSAKYYDLIKRAYPYRKRTLDLICENIDNYIDKHPEFDTESFITKLEGRAFGIQKKNERGRYKGSVCELMMIDPHYQPCQYQVNINHKINYYFDRV